jgi:hypothetical protein
MALSVDLEDLMDQVRNSEQSIAIRRIIELAYYKGIDRGLDIALQDIPLEKRNTSIRDSILGHKRYFKYVIEVDD